MMHSRTRTTRNGRRTAHTPEQNVFLINRFSFDFSIQRESANDPKYEEGNQKISAPVAVAAATCRLKAGRLPSGQSKDET
jgi:hypothetical protein